MTTLRLPPDLEATLDRAVRTEHKSKSRIIIEALREHLEKAEKKPGAFELGQEFFGRHGSGRHDGSTKYKSILKAKLREKRHR